MKVRLLVTLLVLTGTGCQSDAPPPPAVAPAKALLVFPAQNAVCMEGKVISPTQSSILFTWNSSANTDSYEVTIKNLSSGLSTTQISVKPELEVSLTRNTPYSWFVVSKSKQIGITAQSEVWRFYNSGPGTVFYAPFPAEIISPLMGQHINAANGTVTLDWNGGDVDGDVAGFDIYLGTTASPALLKADLAESILSGVTVTANTIYYWKVITKDAKGNTSDSGLFQFRVN